jgi:hypothetical protein
MVGGDFTQGRIEENHMLVPVASRAGVMTAPLRFCKQLWHLAGIDAAKAFPRRADSYGRPDSEPKLLERQF